MIKKLLITVIMLCSASFHLMAEKWLPKAPCMREFQEKVPVKEEDLPEAVKKTLRSETFEGWKVISAFLVTGVDSKQYYELNLKNADVLLLIKLDKQGKKVD